MSRVIQEKFQVNEPLVPESEHQWVSDKSVRVPGVKSGNLAFFNELPPGSNMGRQETFTDPTMPTSLAGDTDVSNNVNPTTMHAGYGRLRMRPTDDMYTREHNDAFYDDIVVDGVTGFVERNNMLDRE